MATQDANSDPSLSSKTYVCSSDTSCLNSIIKFGSSAVEHKFSNVIGLVLSILETT